MSVVGRRPAESAGLAGAAAIVLADLLGLDDPQVITALAVVVASLPAVVTWLVELARSRGSSGGE